MTTTLSFLVINSVYPYGDIHEPGWTVYGEEHKCSLHHHHRYWHGATQGPLSYVMPEAHITRSVYNQLKELGEIEGIRDRIRGVVEDNCIVSIPNPYYGGGTCTALDLDKVIPGLPEEVRPVTCEILGCPLLERYDKDGDGKINIIESQRSIDDERAGIITKKEMEFVIAGWKAGSIDALCPGCHGIIDITINRWALPTHASPGSAITPVMNITNNLDTQASIKVGVSGAEHTTGYPIASGWIYTIIEPGATKDVNCPFTIPTGVDKGTYQMSCFVWSLSDKLNALGSFKNMEIREYTDSCAGVTCVDKCYGYDLWKYRCVNGMCVRDETIKTNDPVCGYTPPPFVCTEGTKRGKETCWNGSVIHKEVCRDNKWVSTGESCPPRVCTEGAKRSPETCWNDSVIHKEVCRGNKWVSTGETCPTRPPAPECTNGDKKPGYVCSGGKWVPTGTTPPPPPSECTNGDVKPGFVCIGDKWIPTGTTPPVPPGTTVRYLTTAEAIERFRMGLPCYIKCILPILSMLPGIPYTPGAWIPPFCAISTEP